MLDHPLIERTARSLEEGTPEELETALRHIEPLLDESTRREDLQTLLWRAVLAAFVEQIRFRLGGRKDAAVSRAELLVTSMHAKTHAADILRAVTLGAQRPADLKKALNLHDVQIHRVLEWAEVQGILWRQTPREAEGATFYRLTPLGARVFDLVDAPPWLPAASHIVRECVEARVEGRPIDTSSLQVGGMPQRQVARAVEELSKSAAPNTTSNLARALPTIAQRSFVITSIIYKDELTDEKLQKRRTNHSEDAFKRHEGRYAPRLDVLGESLVYQALERAGLSTSAAFEEWNPVKIAEDYERSTEPAKLLTNRPIISLSSPLVNPVTLGLLIRFGSPCYFDPNVHTHLVHERRGEEVPRRYSLREDLDHAIVLRFVEPDTELSHFVLAGFKPSGTYAACHFFYKNVERLLATYVDRPFGAIITVPRGYDESRIESEGDEFEIDSALPSPIVDNLDMRFLEVLAVVGESYSSLAEKRQDLVPHFHAMAQKARGLAKKAGSTSIDVGRLLDPTATGQYTYERARALGIVLSENVAFIDDVMLLLARIAAPEVKPAAKEVAYDQKDTFIKSHVLTDVLNLAPYCHTAVSRALTERGLVDEFVRLCVVGPSEPLPFRATAGGA